MTPELYVASKIAQAIKQRYSNVTKQKTIIELLAKDQVEISEGMLSRLFNASYELKKDSRVFKELTSLLSPELAPEDFWNYLVQGYSPDTEMPVALHSAEQKIIVGIPELSILARPIVAMLLNNKLPRGFAIARHEIDVDYNREGKIYEPETETNIFIPYKNNSVSGVDTKESATRGYFSGVLPELLADNIIQMMCCPKQVVEASRFRNLLMPLMKICSSASTQVLIFNYTDKEPQTPLEESRTFEEVLGKTFTENYKVKGRVIYKSFLPKSIDNELERKKYRKDFLDLLFKDDKPFQIRTINKSVTQTEWSTVYQKFLQDAKELDDEMQVSLESLNNDSANNQTIINQLKNQAQRIKNIKSLNEKVSPPIDFRASDMSADYSKIVEKLVAQNGENLLLSGFSPFNFKIIKSIIEKLKEYQKDDDKKELIITRFNLSDMLDLHTDTYLYVRTEQLQLKGNLLKFQELIDSIKWVLDSGMMYEPETAKKLAYFYYGDIDEKSELNYYKPEIHNRIQQQYKHAVDEVHLDYKNNFYSKEFTEFLLDKYLQSS